MTLSTARRVVVLSALLVCAGCRNPQADAQVAEQLRQLADELNGSRQDVAAMHDQIDSLRITVARQDTLVRRLAGMAGVPVTP